MWISLWISVDDWMLRPQDKYLHTNCLAALANMSAQFRCLHQYAAQRIIRWGEKTQLPLSRCYWFYCNKFQVFFFLTRCWFQIKPKPKPYWSIWTKSLPRSNWILQLNIDLPSLFWFALQPQIAATSVLLQKPQSAEKKKKNLGPNVYYLHTLFAEGAFFPPYDSLYKRRQECISVRLEAQPRRYTVYHSSESRAETLLTACMWKMSLHTTGNDVRDEPKFLFHLLKSTAPLVCIISSWCVFPFY